MIPYTGLQTWYIGPVPIHMWGLLVACGFITGILIAKWYCKRHRLDFNRLFDFIFWIIIVSLIGARFGHVFLYNWTYYRENLLEILYVWRGGLSSVGGFIGAAIVIIVWQKRNKKIFWKYADALSFSFPLAWGIGRIGCFLIHDHPGVCANFFLGMRELSGCARHDLGLYESIITFIIFGVFILIARMRKKLPFGLYSASLLIFYSIMRFFLDFLRVWEGPLAETRYLGLTPAQYGCIVLLFVGVVLLSQVKGGRSDLARTN